MRAWLRRIMTRVNFYTAHAHGRLRSGITTTAFYTADFLSNGALKQILQSFKNNSFLPDGKFLPALVTLSSYLLTSFLKAKESYDQHPETTGTNNEREKLRNTTEIIRNTLKKHSHEAKLYLQKAKLEPQQISYLLSAEELEAESGLCEIAHALYHQKHSYRRNYSQALLDTLLQGMNHLNEFRLLKSFADFNLMAFSDEDWALNILACLIVVTNLSSAYCAFVSGIQPQKADGDEVIRHLTRDFGMFRNSLMRTADSEELRNAENSALLENGNVKINYDSI